MVRFSPFELSTRGWFLGAVATTAGSLFLGRGRTNLRPWILGAWLLSFPLIMIVLRGFGENGVLTSNWGGLLLTLILAVVGIVVSFPLGVFLALCRQSDLPAIRWISTAYIEAVRGVPLITILFMGNILVPIFMPGLDINQVLRMMLGITLFFSAAYMAENVRGGLQGIPSADNTRQHKPIGLNYVQTMLFIVLPQALRSVIPAIVGQFIALFKDTSLVCYHWAYRPLRCCQKRYCQSRLVRTASRGLSVRCNYLFHFQLFDVLRQSGN